jgi:2-amino-4-hydroxy-6-hydroxymethyldihydropteridine diphosphokinase
MKSAAVDAFIGLGSNLDEPQRQVLSALRELGELPDSRLIRRSPLYRSAPLGPPGQADYINAVAMLETALGAVALLNELQAIEQRHGRVRGTRWGPRTLDLDLLLYGDQRIDSERLQVPHPRICERAFVLVPLHDVAPDLILPGLGPLAGRIPVPADSGLRPVAELPGGGS